MAETANPTPDQTRVFKRLTVDVHFTPLVENRVLVSWALEKDFREVGPYTFTLYRGHFPTDDGFVAVAQTVDQPWAYDDNPQLGQYGVELYYKVVLTDGNGNTYESQAVHGETYWERYDWTLAREIIRKEHLLQRKRAGTKGYLLKRRDFGDPCSCVNKDTGQVESVSCPTCYGTGVEGGYYEPFEYWVIMNPSQTIVKLDDESGLQTAVIESVRSLAYPTPSPGDMWVHAHTNRRFSVESDVAAIARHRGIDLVLQLRLKERASSEPIYKFPLPCG